MKPFVPSEPQVLMREHLFANEQALLFVGMGIGKTGAALSVIADLIRQRKAKAALVVAPLRVINLTWPLETQGFHEFKHLRVANLRTELGRRAFIKSAADLYLINYESLPKLTALVKNRGGGVPYDIEVWDEASKAKSNSSKRIQGFRRSIPRAKRRWGLTGTPAPNSLLDLFAPVRLIDDGKRLGPSFDHFKSTYFRPKGYMGYKLEAKPEAKDQIHERIADITLTLRSSDWLDIPDTVVEDIEVPLSTDLHKRYTQFERDLILEVRKGKEITATSAAALVSKLLQFTSGSIYDEDKVWHDIHEVKFTALRKLLKEADGPMLVAYHFQHEAARLRKAFPEAEFFADAKNAGSQTLLLSRWNAGKIKMLCCHPQSVGHGLNMQHGGNIIVWLTLTYSRENYEQMIARLARRGQDEVVRVYRLMCPGTVDEAVATAVLEKQKTEANLLEALMLLESYRRSGGGELVEKAEEEIDLMDLI